MILPAIAPVRPRVYAPDSPETVLLEDVVPLLRKRSLRKVALVGPWGSGKTTALAHLAHVLLSDPGIVFLDNARKRDVDAAAGDRLVIFSYTASPPGWADERLHLAPWGRDELIEYLLAVHPGQCGSVMDRVARAGDRRSTGGLPELWRIVLDRLAEDESLTSVNTAMVDELNSRMSTKEIRQVAEDYCRDSLCGDEAAARFSFGKLSKRRDQAAGLIRLLGHRVIEVEMAADNLAAQLAADWPCVFLTRRLPIDLIEVLAERISRREGSLARLREFTEGRDLKYHSTAATLLHTTGCGWMPTRQPAERQPDKGAQAIPRKPPRRRKPKPQPPEIWLNLSGASLPAAAWPGIDLRLVTLTNVDFTAADLSGANLSGTHADGACFRYAILVEAELSQLSARGADFTAADMSRARIPRARLESANLTEVNFTQAALVETDFGRADLTRACFSGADLTAAKLRQARIDGADFSGAELSWADLSGLTLRDASFSGARFRGTKLFRADLEFMTLPEASFEQAVLIEAWLTGSVMPGACFHKASLVRAALADVQWEGADLRAADMREVSFHMGSSRSGLVNSPIAGEGSRTGFYTDDFSQQHFKAPEEIRKANLRGADLREAIIEGTDFYLVDLRGAQYTSEQREHFRRCGAILD